jgi:hypothetical protein
MSVKVLKDDMLHFDFQYKFYYCEIEELDSHIYRGDMLCVVEIPEDAIIIPLQFSGNKYFRTDKLILTDRIYRFDNNNDVKE